MRIVVTGATGFLGRRLARRLREEGRDVVLVARGPLDAPGAVRVREYAQTPGGDVLVHLAERADRAAVEALGSRHGAEARATLDALLARDWERVIYASSGVVYGDGGESPRREDDPTPGPGHYAAAKRACETRIRGAGGTSLRLANLYGPGQPDGTVLSDILAQVPGAGPLQVRDAGPVRDFLWVDDAVDAIVRLFDRGRADVYNVASGQGIAIGSLARMVLEAAGEPDRPVRETAPGGRPSRLVMDVTRARDELGWVPRVSPREGVARLLGARAGAPDVPPALDGR